MPKTPVHLGMPAPRTPRAILRYLPDRYAFPQSLSRTNFKDSIRGSKTDIPCKRSNQTTATTTTTTTVLGPFQVTVRGKPLQMPETQGAPHPAISIQLANTMHYTHAGRGREGQLGDRSLAAPFPSI